jgi:hypothetical protein
MQPPIPFPLRLKILGALVLAYPLPRKYPPYYITKRYDYFVCQSVNSLFEDNGYIPFYSSAQTIMNL